MIWLLIRETVDWQNYSYDLLEEYLKSSTLYKQTVEPKIKLMRKWDQTFSIPYFQYRHQVKELAKQSWDQLGATIVEGHLDLSQVQDDDIILTTDDDDWFSPELPNVLPEVMENHDMITWDCLVNDMWRGSFYSWWTPSHIITVGSNSYAITGRAAKALSDKELKNFLYLHSDMLMVAFRARVNVLCMASHSLSCYNIHAGAVSNKLFGKMPISEPRNLTGWTKPYREQMYDLVKNTIGDKKLDLKML